jgi:hypothetical protein
MIKKHLLSLFFILIGYISFASDTITYKIEPSQNKDFNLSLIQNDKLIKNYVIINDSISINSKIVNKQLLVFKGENDNKLVVTQTNANHKNNEIQEIRFLEFNSIGEILRNIQIYFGDGCFYGYTPYYLKLTKKNVDIILHSGVISGVSPHQWFYTSINKKGDVSPLQKTQFNDCRFDIYKLPDSKTKIIIGIKKLPKSNYYLSQFEKQISEIQSNTIQFNKEIEETKEFYWIEDDNWTHLFYKNKLWLIYDDNKNNRTYISIIDFSTGKPLELSSFYLSNLGIGNIKGFDTKNERMIFWDSKWAEDKTFTPATATKKDLKYISIQNEEGENIKDYSLQQDLTYQKVLYIDSYNVK